MSARTAGILQTAFLAATAFLLSFIFLAALTHVAHAQSLNVQAPSAAGDAVASALIQALMSAAIAAIAAIIALLPNAFGWLTAHTRLARSQWAEGVKNRFLGMVEQFVLQELQTTVDVVKSQRGKGAISPAAASVSLAAVKSRVVANARAAATAQGIAADLAIILGVDTGGPSIEQFASGAVEGILARTKLKAGVQS